MRELNIPRAHSNSWYDHLASVQDGYYYPWKSIVGERNGEEAFLHLVQDHLTPESKVLEVGCGHGDLALQFAPSCQHILAFDRVESYIELANNAKTTSNTANVEFRAYDVADPRISFESEAR